MFKIKLSQRVVGVGTREGWARVREGAKAVKHDMNFFKFSNLISLTISNKA